MILGVVCLLVANLASVLWARRLLERFRTGRAYLDLLLFLLIRLLLISAVVLVAGMTWTLTAGRLGTVASIALGAGIFRLKGRNFHLKGRNFHLKVEATRVVVLLATAVVVARLLLQTWFFAPYAGDPLSYHLPKIAEWVRAGHFTLEMGPDTHAWFPAGFELIETWWVVFLHHDVLIEVAGIEFLLLAGAAVFALAKHLQLSDGWAYFAALSYALTPGVHLQATSSLNDLPVAALVLATAALVVHGAPRSVIGIAVGLGIGIKGTYIYALPGLALLWWLEQRTEQQEKTPRRFFPARAASAARAAAPFAIAALLVGGFWYARNAWLFANPLYPAGSKGVLETDGRVTVRLGASPSGLWHNITDLVENRIGDREAAYSALSRRVSGWGALSYACGLPALFVLLPTDRRLRRFAAAWVVSLLSVLLLVIFDDWYIRFTFFFPALLVLAVARLASEHRGVLVVAVPALLLQFASTMVAEELPLAKVKVLAEQPWRARSTAGIYDAHIDGVDAIGYYADNYNDSYLMYRPDFSRRVAFVRATTAQGFMDEMKQAGVTTLYAAPGTLERQRVINELAGQGLLRNLRGKFWIARP